MRGVNPRGDKFIAHEVFCDASLPVADHKADMMNTLNGMYVYKNKLFHVKSFQMIFL